MTGDCATLDASGVSTVGGDCSEDFKSFLCAAVPKESIVGQKWTSYFSEVIVPNHYGEWTERERERLESLG